MDAERAIEILERQRDRSRELQTIHRGSPEFKKWYRDTEIAIQRIFSEDRRHLEDFTKVRYHLGVFGSSTPESRFQEAYVKGLQNADSILASMVDEIKEYAADSGDNASLDVIDILERICHRFHLVARQLRVRHGDRSTLEIEDEYDVQDLLHALLHQHFDDIRREEWTPSYAGGASRVDFLLKTEQIIVEVKKTRQSLSEADLGAQLLVDIARYKSHPDCDSLVCFVYDPELRIGNPAGLETDLESTSNAVPVKVIIGPQGL